MPWELLSMCCGGSKERERVLQERLHGGRSLKTWDGLDSMALKGGC